MSLTCLGLFVFFNDAATTEIYTLSLHDALPISAQRRGWAPSPRRLLAGGLLAVGALAVVPPVAGDRKSTRLNSSHVAISYAVFCLKKKKIGLLAVHRALSSPPTRHLARPPLLHS